MAVRGISDTITLAILVLVGIALAVSFYFYGRSFFGGGGFVSANAQLMSTDYLNTPSGTVQVAQLRLAIKNTGSKLLTIDKITVNYVKPDGSTGTAEFTYDTANGRWVLSTDSGNTLDTTKSIGDGGNSVGSKGSQEITLTLVTLPGQTIRSASLTVTLKDPAGNTYTKSTASVQFT